MTRRAGLTLIELLVAVSIFVVLGGALVLFLKVGIDTWRVGEIRREAFERSGAIFAQLEDDLSSAFTDPSHGTGGRVDVILLSDYDGNGRQRLRFVRTLAGEMRHPITQRAGALTSGRMDYDYVNDAIESEMGYLRAPGGLQEVAYLMDPDPQKELLWRGVKSPIGGSTTLFDETNLYEVEDYSGGEETLEPRRCRPFADGILYLEFNFWGQETRSWRVGEEDGALPYWDSTRGILDPGAGFEDLYADGSRDEHRDDVFPFRVQVTLVLRPARAVRLARLTAPLDERSTEIPVDTTRHYPEGAFQYLRIGDEWIHYHDKSGRTFTGLERGVRGTEPASHAAGTPVIYGSTFTRVIRVAGGRASNWGERR